MTPLSLPWPNRPRRKPRLIHLLLPCALAGLVAASLPSPLSAMVAPSQPGDGERTPTTNRLAPHPTPVAMGAVVNVDTGLAFASIQAAVSAASTLPGHTLEVQAASLPEGLVDIDKSLTLRGATGTEVVLASQSTGSAGDARGWFLVQSGVDLQVESLTFDGNGFSIHQAFRHRGSGGFAGCSFRDIQFNPSGPEFAGTAIVAFGGPVDVVGCSFASIGRVGVLAFGAGVSGMEVTGNTYLGKGDGSFLDYGLEVGAGAVVTARGNTYSACRGVAPDSSRSAGVLITTFFGPGTGATLTSNTFTGNDIGIALGNNASDTSTLDAAFNRVVGNQEGINSTVVSPIALAERNWWGCNGGPAAVGCDSVVGSVDVDPWLLLTLAANPGALSAGQSSALLAALVTDSDGADTSGVGTVPDGIPTAFAGTLGSVNPVSAPTSGGSAGSLFTAGGAPGTAQISATIDNETVLVDIPITVFTPQIPSLGSLGLTLLAGLLAAAALRFLRR